LAQELQPALDEGGIQIVFGAGISLPNVRLAPLAGRAEGRIHQHHVVPAPHQVDKGDALLGVSGEEPPGHTTAVPRAPSVRPQRLHYPLPGLGPEHLIVQITRAQFHLLRLLRPE